MTLKESQKKYLRGLGHALNPTITVGDKGLTESLLAEYESTLKHHELIKVKVRAGDRSTRDDMIRELCSGSSAELIQRIGNIALLYRENPENNKIRLPKS
jgi:RNA-binding protein